MDKWLEDMEYLGKTLSEEAKLQIELKNHLSKSHTRKVWKHIFTHVRPKEECRIIKKQCLLQRLQTGSLSIAHIQLKCLKDFDVYEKARRNEFKIKKIKQIIEEKKISISENLHRLLHNRQSSIKEEYLLKESVYKLDHLKKKRKTVERSIQKLEKEFKILQILSTNPNRFADFGSNTTNWERKVLLFVEELLDDFKLEIIISKMEELAKTSQLPPVPKWDRSEILTEMEKTLMDKLKLKKKITLKLEELDEIYIKKKSKFLDFKGKFTNNFYLISDFMDEIHKDALIIGRALMNRKPPYVLEREQFNSRRLNNLNETKARDLCKVRFDDQDYISLYKSTQSSKISISKRPIFEKMKDSVIREIRCFMALSLWPEPPMYSIDYIQPCLSSSSELNSLKLATAIHLKVIQLVEKICNINLPTFDVKSTSDELDIKLIPLFSSLSEKISEMKKEELSLEDIYNRVKDAFSFLHKEPLNESLGGVKIEGEDINYWLNRYAKSKKKHDHELWILNNNTLE